MERLTAKNKHGKPIIKDWPNYMEFDIINHLAAIEDILGDEYDLDELSKAIAARRRERRKHDVKLQTMPCGLCL